MNIGLKGAKVSGDMDCIEGSGDLVGKAEAEKLAIMFGGLHVRTEMGAKSPDCGHLMLIGVGCINGVLSEPKLPWLSVPSTFIPKGVGQ